MIEWLSMVANTPCITCRDKDDGLPMRLAETDVPVLMVASREWKFTRGRVNVVHVWELFFYNLKAIVEP